MGDIATFIFTGLLFLLLFFVQNRARQKVKEPEEIEPMQEGEMVLKRPSSSLNLVKDKKVSYALRATSLYEVKRKKKSSFLLKSLANKDSIKQAFVLSEILKRKDGL